MLIEVSTLNVFLKPKAFKWCKEDIGMMDGLTTNGVLILHPLSGQHGIVDKGPGLWREVSIAGDIYALRRARSDRGAGKKVLEKGTVLQLFRFLKTLIASYSFVMF